MEDNTRERHLYYIVSNPRLVSENASFLLGSLWVKPSNTGCAETCELYCLDTQPKTAKTYSLQLFERLYDEDVKDYLIAVKKLEERFAIFQNKEWLEEASRMTKGTQVNIVSVSGIPEGVLGTIRYRGALPGSSGIKFGVEIIEPTARGKGTTDGVWKKERFFDCEDNCGLFVNISKLRLHKKEQFNFSLTEDLGPSVELKSNVVKTGDRVVWMSDNGPEFGTVLWMGILSDDPSREAMVGVEFDNAVGSGTGKYKGKQLFTARKGHASLVPVIGLLKEEELLGDYSATPPDVVPRLELSERITVPEKRAQPYGSYLQLNAHAEIRASPPRYGVIRWIGPKPGSQDTAPDKLMAGLEMEETDNKCYTNGTFLGRRLFTCTPYKAFFIHLHKCHPDRRAILPQREPISPIQDSTRDNNGGIIFENLRGARREPVEYSDSDSTQVIPYLEPRTSWSEDMCGKNKGIQGGKNSCYMDSVLFSLFSCTSVFDFLFFIPDSQHAIQDSDVVRRSLQEFVVNPLRCSFFVSSEYVMKFRKTLAVFKPEAGFDKDMKDPEEFLNCLFGEVLQISDFLHLSSGHHSYLYQLFGHRDIYKHPSVQQLLEYSVVDTNVRFKNSPRVLLLQLPRYGAERVHDFIFPSPTIDISDVLEGHPRQCALCSNIATVECPTCFIETGTKKLADCTFCLDCYDDEHCHEIEGHFPRPLQQNQMGQSSRPKREKLSLLAVVCIDTSHYVSYVKCGLEADARWIFFDSMAETREDVSFPEVSVCDDVSSWLAEYKGSKIPLEYHNYSHMIKNLAQDAYMCIYG